VQKISRHRVNRKSNPEFTLTFPDPCLNKEVGRRTSSEWGLTGKILKVTLSVLFVCFFSGWIIWVAEGTSGERNPFALPAGAGPQEGGDLQKKAGTGPQESGDLLKKAGAEPGNGKLGQESSGGFRVTIILVSGQNKVAAINGVLVKKGDKLGDYKILEIEDKQVTLVRGKEKMVLKIDSTVGYSFKKVNSNHQLMELPK
jgi:hypothetical protein